MISRKHYADRVKKALGRNPVVALLGPRQCGKTTLARQVIPAGHPHYFDLQNPVVARLMEKKSFRRSSPTRLGSNAVHSGSELDLLMEIGGKRLGVEFKRADAPQSTRSMHLAITDLGLDELWVVYPGTRSYALDDRIKVRPLAACIQPHKTSGRIK